MNDLMKTVNVLLKEGTCKVKEHFNDTDIQAIVNEVNKIYDENVEDTLGPAVNILSLSKKELRTYGDEREVVEKSNKNFYLTTDDFTKGLLHYRNLTNARSVVQPLIVFPSLINLVLDEFLLDVVSKYFGEEAKIGYVKVRRFFTNDLPDFDTNYFHEDDNCNKLLKAIIPLTKMKSEDGSFQYVAGSHKKKMLMNGDFAYSKNESDVVNYYGKESIKSYETNLGDIIFADTLGIHRGLKPIKSDRIVVFVNYVTEPEYKKETSGIFIHENIYKGLTDRQQQCCEYLKVIS